ncbi:methionyl-tRNA formyltransferase [Candidatus Saccharibacteria bacterium]|nr:methionyl-tRNA formyltransferase [Candidatus Saccharibacteria bacterium]
MAAKPKIVFFGSPAFGQVILNKLLDEKHRVDAVVTQPDRSRGRGRKKLPTPVKITAKENKITAYTPENRKQLSDLTPRLKRRKPDLFTVASYGMIIPKEILEIATRGALNVHPSLLPLYRGPSPIQTAILEGEEKTGVTIILMDEEMDHGPILSQKEVPIAQDDNAQTLTAKLAYFGGELLTETIDKHVKGETTPKPQEHEKATYTKLIKKEDGRVDLETMSNTKIDRMIRAYTPWPGVWATVGEMATQLERELKNKKHKHLRLKLLSAKQENGVLALETVQVEGKKPISFQDFVKGYLQ